MEDAGLVVVTINTAGAEGVEARPRVDLVCQVARSVDHGERASVVVNERASEQAVVFAAHDADVVVARLGVWCLRHGVSPSPSSGAMHAQYHRRPTPNSRGDPERDRKSTRLNSSH